MICHLVRADDSSWRHLPGKKGVAWSVVVFSKKKRKYVFCLGLHPQKLASYLLFTFCK